LDRLPMLLRRPVRIFGSLMRIHQPLPPRALA